MKLIFTLATMLFVSTASAGWLYEQDIDEFTDEKSTHAILHGSRNEAILINCFPSGSIEAKVLVGEFLNTDFDPVPIKYRVDKGRVVNQTWKAYNNRTAYASGENAINFVTDISNGKKLVLAADNYKGHEHKVTFDITGGTESITKILRDCGKKVD